MELRVPWMEADRPSGVVAEVMTGKFCRRLGPGSGSWGSLGVTPLGSSFRRRGLCRAPPLSKMEFRRMRVARPASDEPRTSDAVVAVEGDGVGGGRRGASHRVVRREIRSHAVLARCRGLPGRRRRFLCSCPAIRCCAPAIEARHRRLVSGDDVASPGRGAPNHVVERIACSSTPSSSVAEILRSRGVGSYVVAPDLVAAGVDTAEHDAVAAVSGDDVAGGGRGAADHVVGARSGSPRLTPLPRSCVPEASVPDVVALDLVAVTNQWTTTTPRTFPETTLRAAAEVPPTTLSERRHRQASRRYDVAEVLAAPEASVPMKLPSMRLPLTPGPRCR